MAYRTDPYDGSIVIDGWENGIADSELLGISDMRNVNVISVPGEASVNFAMTQASFSSYSGNVTGSSDANDTITLSIAPQDGLCLVFSGASLPTGVTAGTKYLIKLVSGFTCRVYTSYANYIANSYQNITSDGGTGTFVSVDMAKPVSKAYDSTTGNSYVSDTNGRIWKLATSGCIYCLGTDSTTTTNANGLGLIAYRGYLFSFRNALIDYMNGTTGAWTYGWQTMNTAAGVANSHYAYLGQDDVVYYCDGPYLGSFRQNSGATFDPATAATYTWNSQALNLPSDDKAYCLAELGTNLLVGGLKNAIYPWNRTSTSFTYPILLAEKWIQRMVTVNTNTYILAGQRGRIYLTNGSQASLYKKIPDHISGTVEPYFDWGDLDTNKNQIYFGVRAKTNTAGALNQYGGVWAIDVDTQSLRLTNRLSYATYAGIASVILPQASTSFPSYQSGVGFWVGWDSGASTYGVDSPNTVPYTSSEATIDSELIPIGTYDKPRDMTRVEYKLSKPLVSGESITIKYRLIFDTTDTGYTTVLTDSTAGNFSSSGAVNFKNAQWVQFQIVMNSTQSSPSYVRLKEIRITGIR